MKYVVGLGNPGKKYELTRHNIGFMIVEKACALAVQKNRHAGNIDQCDRGTGSVTGRGYYKSCIGLIRKIFRTNRDEVDSGWHSYQNMLLCNVPQTCEDLSFVKPMTFMNLSGEVFSFLSDEVKPEDILVVADELYLPLGRMRFRPKGSAGGHNGLRSIEDSLGTDEYNRLRVGVGREQACASSECLQQEKPDGESIIDFVLGEFPEEEIALLEEVIQTAAEGVLAWVDSGIQQVQQQYNGKNLRI